MAGIISYFIVPLIQKIIPQIELNGFLFAVSVICVVLFYLLFRKTQKLEDLAGEIEDLAGEIEEKNNLIKKLECKVSELEKTNNLFNKLGILDLFPKAETTIEESLNDTVDHFWWLGTSSSYVVSTPAYKDKYFRKKASVEKIFVTLDPECTMVISEHAAWQGEIETESEKSPLQKRIETTKQNIEEMKCSQQISWEGYPHMPTFRVVCVDNNYLLISFYERGMQGPEAPQLKVRKDGLLGKWFYCYFEKTLLSSQILRIKKLFTYFLLKQIDEKNTLLSDFKKFYNELPTHIYGEILKNEKIEIIVSELLDGEKKYEEGSEETSYEKKI